MSDGWSCPYTYPQPDPYPYSPNLRGRQIEVPMSHGWSTTPLVVETRLYCSLGVLFLAPAGGRASAPALSGPPAARTPIASSWLGRVPYHTSRCTPTSRVWRVGVGAPA